VPETYKTALGVDGPDTIQTTGTTGELLGESDGDQLGGGSPQSVVETGSPVAPTESDALGAQPEQPDARLQEQANAYEWLMQDPQLSAMINENVSARLGQTPQVEPTAVPAESGVTREEFNRLQTELQKVTNQAATKTINDFAAGHPDFIGELRNTTGAFVKQYGLPLPQAYYLAQMQLNGGKPVAQQRTATTLPAESGPGGGGARVASGPVDIMAEAQEEVNRLPQSPRRFEDAVGIMIKAAQQKHAGS